MPTKIRMLTGWVHRLVSLYLQEKLAWAIDMSQLAVSSYLLRVGCYSLDMSAVPWVLALRPGIYGMADAAESKSRHKSEVRQAKRATSSTSQIKRSDARACVCASVCPCVRLSVRPCVRACVRAFVRACLWLTLVQLRVVHVVKYAGRCGISARGQRNELRPPGKSQEPLCM